MFNKIESEYTKDSNLIKFYKRQSIKKILYSILISFATYLVLNFTDFNLAYVVGIIFLELIILNVHLTINQLIDYKWNSNETQLDITYFNLLDKIVTERFNKNDILWIKHRIRKKMVKIELTDYRQIELFYKKDFSIKIDDYYKKRVLSI